MPNGMREKASICLDYSDKRSLEVIKLLRDAGLHISATPAAGVDPELKIGSQTFFGVPEIKKFVRGLGDSG